MNLCDAKQNHDYVIEFNDLSIESTLEQASYSLIYFYSENCKYCSSFDPDFDYLSNLYNDFKTNDTKEFQIVKTNALKNKRLSELFKVAQYPTLKLLDYKTKKIKTYQGDREINTLIEYLKRETLISPDFNNFRSNVKYLNSDDFDDYIYQSETDTLVVFTLPYLEDWIKYYYPSHFYQRMAFSEYTNNLKFALVDVEKISSNDLLARLKLSHFPAMMYFSPLGKFKVYQEKNQIQSVKSRMGQEDVELFLNHLESKEQRFGQWYDNIEEFHRKTGDRNFELVNFGKGYGFSVKQDSISDEDVDIDEEYEILLHNLSL